MRALERDREQRFATAAEMAAALDDFVVASKLHVDDVVDLRARDREAAAPLPVLVAPAVVRRGRRAREQRFEGDRAPARRRVRGAAAATARARDVFTDARRGGARRDVGGAGRGNGVRLRATVASGIARRAEAARSAAAAAAAAACSRQARAD